MMAARVSPDGFAQRRDRLDELLLLLERTAQAKVPGGVVRRQTHHFPECELRLGELIQLSQRPRRSSCPYGLFGASRIASRYASIASFRLFWSRRALPRCW